MSSHGTRQWTEDLRRLTAERDALRDAAAALLDALVARREAFADIDLADVDRLIEASALTARLTREINEQHVPALRALVAMVEQ